jgi:bla regulator protein blaR1
MIKATIVLLAAHALLPWLQRRSAAQRHALWTAVLAVATVIPILTWFLPSWEPAWAQRAAETWPAVFESRSAVATTGDIVVRATGIESDRTTLGDILPWLWMGGSALLFVALARHVMHLRRLTKAGVSVPVHHAIVANRVAAALTLPPPRITCSDRLHIPLAWGFRRAHILLPAASRDWPDERVWAVCAHEMAHISRGDWIAHLLAEIACRIYWFNPLFWSTRNRVGHESERAADDVVIGLGASGAEYASHLIDIVRAARPDDGLAPAVAMARLPRFGRASRGSSLEGRVAALLSGLVNRARLSRRAAIAILLGACVVTGPLAALSARARSIIEIQTSNLPPIHGIDVRELAGDESEPVRDIRLLHPADGDVAPSVAEYTTPPLYSDEARRRAIEGVAIVQARIDAGGRVDAARVTAGPGFGLDQNALVALRQWGFRPGTRNGTAVPMDVEIDIAFTLRNESINAQIANDMVSLVGPGITPPQAVRVVDPVWPREGVTGTVVLDIVLLEDGTPRVVRILRSLRTDLDDIAVGAFAQWRFSPAQKDGRPIKVRMNAAVRFHG